jgi:hypothetical protein
MATDFGRRAVSGARVPACALAALVLLCPSAPALADTMRCGSQVINEGDTIEDVLAACGEPTTRTRTWIQRQPRFEMGGQEHTFPGREDVPVDLWTYDRGPNRLTQRVRFIASKVASIETMGN